MVTKCLVTCSTVLAGCELVFPLEAPDAKSPVPCTPGEVARFEGDIDSAAAVDGLLIAGYREASGAIAVRAIDRAGTPALPRMLSDVGESLRVGADPARATITLHTSMGTGWDQVITTSMRNGELESTPARRTPTGVHSTHAASIARDNEFILAARSQPGGQGEVFLAISGYAADWKLLALVDHSLDLGDPVAFSTSSSGVILQTTKNMIALDGNRALSTPIPTTGFDEISFVQGTPAESPALVRASGGAIEVVDLDDTAAPLDTRSITTGRSEISALHAQAVGGDVLAIWSEPGGTFALRSTVDTPSPSPSAVEISGTPVSIYQGDAGPIAVMEQAQPVAEVVIVQLCGF